MNQGAPAGERAAELFPTDRNGLTEAQVRDRRARWGPNRLPTRPDPTIATRLGQHLSEPLTALLLVAAVVGVMVLGETVEGLAIGSIVVLNVAIGVIEERRAGREGTPAIGPAARRSPEDPAGRLQERWRCAAAVWGSSSRLALRLTSGRSPRTSPNRPHRRSCEPWRRLLAA